MSYRAIPGCRTDEHYNQKFLKGSDKEFVRGFDWCVEAAVENFFNSDMFELTKSETYLGHTLSEPVPESLRTEYTFRGDGLEQHRSVVTYADLIRYKLLQWVEMERNMLITSMIDNMSDEEYAAAGGKTEPAE